MKITEIRKMSDKEIAKALLEKQAEVKQFRFDIAGSRAKNLQVGGNAKKAVARMMTELQARASAN
jgi:ribosomal protein L29